MQDAEQLRLQATEESMKIREGAELYARQVLTSLEDNLTQLQQVVKNGQIYMEQIKNDSARYTQQPVNSGNRGWANNKDAKKL